MTTILFPGQGAQRLGMGAALFDLFPQYTAEAGDILGYDIAELCRSGPIEKLSQTQFTQPALFVVNALKYLQYRKDGGAVPDFVLGHSVAEYVALFAAGALAFGPALRLVMRRGALMAQASGGGMAAILGLDAGAINDLIAREGLSDIYPANFNTPRQIVVSGRRAAVEAGEAAFLAAGATHYIMLPVSGAFHTPFMQDAADAFAHDIAATEFAPLQVPVISNVTARPHDDASLRARLIEQITAPVRWSDSLRYLMAQGVRFGDTIELGPDGPPVVRPMFKRTEIEAGPLPAAEISAPRETLCNAASDTPRARRFTVENLGSRGFCDAFGLRHAYVSGAMYQGIASVDLVVRMGRAGLLGFFGAAGLPGDEIRSAVRDIKAALGADDAFGVNFIAHVNRPHLEDDLTDLLLDEGVRMVEASAFMEVTQALVRYRAKGLRRDGGVTRATNRIIAKVSRPDVAAQFLAPAPEAIVARLLQSGAITRDEADLLAQVPMADAICVESDSGGHTDQGMPFALLPPILGLRDAAMRRFADFGPIFVGSGGGIGTPEAVAAVLMLGADFIVTGSINQCTAEAGTSDAVKDMLQGIAVYDTAYAPSGEMFELGSKVQVLKKGVFFPARAERLVGLYRQYDSIDALDAKLRRQIEDRYFGRDLDAVFQDVARSYPAAEIERAERMPKHRMALIFRRYFKDTTQWALQGDLDHKVDFQVHCGPAQGAFNAFATGTEIEDWRARHADEIGLRLLEGAAEVLNRRVSAMLGPLA
ncbi:ACP S-malonyltransferase [Oceaniovalibus sp. ACAM 378]|uniref:ACP S-malonyltransferase n=1 Tax=Oceaniovalibus sp. ACAM 378 TaxID=2599923 RepID=UPI0011D5AF02|nr:ACP S-malonyltransferase [Oceaniovalibus sp. ACAM 378]TYB89461.1 ACP S-malonyltransferase [Oceaniovalibus sp. ACAM 378]